MRKKGYLIISLILIVSLVIIITGTKQTEEQGWQEVNEILKQVKEPEFKDVDFNILDFGALAGNVINTKAIQYAIDSCSAMGGGRVIVPEGEFLTGALHLKNNVNLHVSKNARLKFSTNPDDYLPLVITRWEGMDCFNYSPLIYSYGQENIAITGKGILDGQADNNNWWPWKGKYEYGWRSGMNSQLNKEGRPLLQYYEENETAIGNRIMGDGAFLRPQFVNFYECKNILIEDVSIHNAPFWLIHPVFSENIIIRNIRAVSHGPNNDGFDPESSRNILVENCYFNTGDDCIAIKSGRNKDGRKAAVPSENIIIRNCKMENGHGGVVIGSEISGGARNIFVENCTMDSPELERAIRIKTNSNRGGMVENLYVRNITIGRVKEAVLKINCEYDIKNEGTGSWLPMIKNVYLSDIHSEESEYAVFLQGIENEVCIDSIFIKDSKFKGVEKESLIRHSGYVKFKAVEIEHKTGK